MDHRPRSQEAAPPSWGSACTRPSRACRSCTGAARTACAARRAEASPCPACPAQRVSPAQRKGGQRHDTCLGVHQVLQALLGQLPLVNLRRAARSVSSGAERLMKAHLLLDGAGAQEAVHVHALLLAVAPDASSRLLVVGWVPVGVEQHQAVAANQVQAAAASLGRQQERKLVRRHVVELLDQHLALGDGDRAVQAQRRVAPATRSAT